MIEDPRWGDSLVDDDGEDLDDFRDFDTLADLSLLLGGDFSRLDVFFDFLGFLSFFVTFLTFERSFSILFSLPRISCQMSEF